MMYLVGVMNRFQRAGYLVFALLLFVTMPVQAEEAKRAVVAFAQDTLRNDFRKAQVMAVRDAIANQPNLEFIYSDAQGKTALLIRHIENFISKKVDVLIVGTNDESAVVPVISKAHQAGIKVIVLDRGVKTRDYTTFINSDNYEIGAVAGRFITDKLNGVGKVLLLEGILTADVTQLRSRGFLDVVANSPKIQVIKRTGNYLRKDALMEMERLLASGERVDAIFSESDSMLSGVRPVLAKYGIDPATVVMVGVDYISEARQAIRDGEQTATIKFPLGGPETVDTVIKVLADEHVPDHIVIPVQMVTSENVESVTPIF